MDYLIGLRKLRALGVAALVGLTACPDGETARPATGTDTDPTVGDDEDDTTTGDGADESTSDDGETMGETGPEGDICLLLNCEEDLHCSGCEDGNTVCDTDQNACVACDPQTGIGNCEDDEECSEFGYCVPAGQDCPTSDGGIPTIDCSSDADCAACDSAHQVCDDGQCVACTSANEEWCQSIEHCEQGECISDCPDSCQSDTECGLCETEGGVENHACFAHRCAECSDTFPCPDGEVCNSQGECTVPCGIPGQIPGTCDVDGDCAGCPEGSQSCNAPINGGHGTCGASAAGCSDLGEGLIVLPDPYGEVTDLCSDDNDCNGVGVDYNVGQLLRDITGVDAIDDAIISYPMASCADASVETGDGHTISCGVCVPCQEDDDCLDISVDDVANDAFGPLGAIATAILLDALFGPNDHTIHMYCNPITAQYGVCQPCPAIGTDCTATPEPPDDPPDASCDHDVCEEGGPLAPSCGSCAASVCAFDAFCCNNTWDGICVDHVEDHCAGSCDGGDGGNCSHDQCEVGDPLSPLCNACTSAICANDPFCCQTEWDHVCVGQVATICDGDCDDDDDGCIHSECDVGGPLSASCSTCAGDVCAQDGFCCSTDWDGLCVDAAEDLCSDICHEGGCAHDVCATGAPLEDGCSGCVTDVCGQDSFCCDNFWDGICVGLVESECGIDCDGSDPPPEGCEHDACVQGVALEDGCDSCVTDVCNADSFCCEFGWDATCVAEADELCGCFASCAHSACAEGVALEDGCSQCVSDVCDADSFCCSTNWDAMCVGQADMLCGGCTNDCEHGLCEQGVALDSGCDPCVADVCDEDPFCCSTNWDGICVGLADDLCNCGLAACEHDVCETGTALEDGCDDCVDLVCFDDAFCCSVSWDSTCVAEADTLCGCDTCEHDVCETGDALVDGCSDCVTDVCDADSFCCTVSWDSTCVGEAESICAENC